MKHQRLISTALIVSGILLMLRAPTWIFVAVHFHPPGEFLYRSEMLEKELEGDNEKLVELAADRRAAEQRVRGVLDHATTSMWWLAACGILNLYCGIVMMPSRRKCEPTKLPE